MFTKLRTRLIYKLAALLREHSGNYTSHGDFGKDVILKGALLFGKIKLGDNCKLRDGVTILAGSQVSIGRYTSLSGPGTDIHSNVHPVTIGAFTSIARNVAIQEFNHRFDRVTTYNIFSNIIDGDIKKDVVSKGSIEIGNNVWIGTQCAILSGVKIGNGAVIAANSTVTSDIPPYAIAGGSPAKVISYRFSEEIIDALEKTKWWEWPVEKIKANRQFFEGTPTKESILNLL